MKIDALNDREKSRNGTAVYGITSLCDVNQDEFKSRYLGGRPAADVDCDNRRLTKAATVMKYTGTETSVDWSGRFTTPMKDQGQCASCW